MSELYKKYRPRALKHVLGQEAAIKSLAGMLEKKKVPHALLFSGPSGCGKTTLARIMALELGAGPTDAVEINAADFRGIDMVRDIRERMRLSTFKAGGARVWIIDEAHQLSSQAQNAFLKMLEDPPGHVYFMFATTDAPKLLRTVRNRCTEVVVRGLSPQEIAKLIKRISEREELALSEDVRDAIIDAAEGSARKALVLLDSIASVESEEDQLGVVQASRSEKQAIDLARALIAKQSWAAIAKLIREVSDDPETCRRVILKYASSVLLSKGQKAGREYLLVDAFRDNFYDSGISGLIAACYEVCFSK